MDSVSKSSMIWGIIGTTPLMLMFLASGFFISENPVYKVFHMAILITAFVIYVIETIKPYSTLRKLLPFFLALVGHSGLIALEKGGLYFNPLIIYVAFFYFMIAIFAGVFIPTYYHKIVRDRIKENGIKAMAFVEGFADMGMRLTENGVFKSYKVKLKLVIEDHPKSPYKVTDIFFVSEFYIHQLTSGLPIPVRVDRKNQKKVALDLTRSG